MIPEIKINDGKGTESESLLFENEEYSKHQEYEADEMVPRKGFVFEEENCEQREDRERYNLLNNF